MKSKNKTNKVLVISSIFIFILFGGIFGIVRASFATPDITKMSGTLNHGSTFTISGSGFGTKNPAVPLLWVDGEKGTATDYFTELLPSNSGADYNTIFRTTIRGEAQAHSRSAKYLAGAHDSINDRKQQIALNMIILITLLFLALRRYKKWISILSMGAYSSISILLITTFFPIYYANATMRLYYQNFEEAGDIWKNDFESGSVWAVPEPDLIKKVSNNQHSGSYSIRGNLNGNVTDPITGVAGNIDYSGWLQFNLIRSPMAINTPTQVYISYWFRYDDCAWSGPTFDGSSVTGKGAYFNMNNNPATSFFTGMAGGNSGGIRFANNNPAWDSFVFSNWGTQVLYLTTGHGWGADNTWHRLEMHVNYSTHIAKIWVDGYLATSAQRAPTGEIPVPSDYHIDSIQFWYNHQDQLSTSVNRTGYCNGWQLDDIEIWDGIPGRPNPPTNLIIR